jgi:hypothetical protein
MLWLSHLVVYPSFTDWAARATIPDRGALVHQI